MIRADTFQSKENENYYLCRMKITIFGSLIIGPTVTSLYFKRGVAYLTSFWWNLDLGGGVSGDGMKRKAEDLDLIWSSWERRRVTTSHRPFVAKSGWFTVTEKNKDPGSADAERHTVNCAQMSMRKVCTPGSSKNTMFCHPDTCFPPFYQLVRMAWWTWWQRGGSG